jgi:DNA-directed RNA polymerase subunit RPC12/RpoP
MPKPDHDPSADHEPQRKSRPARPDPSEEHADRVLGDSSKPRSAEDLAKHSVFDEPDIFPGRKPETIAQDWSCGNCGYNLRGLRTGHRCPECGHLELYRPPPPEEVSFSSWYRERQAAMSSRQSWALMILAALFAAPAAVVGAVIISAPSPFTVLILAPAAEEAIKIVAIVLIADAKPFFIKDSRQIWIAAAASALLYAVVHNAVILAWFAATPTLGLILGRWIGCTALHLGCTVLAARGVVAAWEKADHEARMPKISEAAWPLTHAVVLHAGLNALLFFWGAKGLVF